MNIGFFSQNMQKELSGINRMAVEEISGLVGTGKKDDYYFVGQSEWLRINVPFIPIITNLTGVTNISLAVLANKIDIIHSFFNAFYVNRHIKCKRILTISDLSPIIIPYSCDRYLTEYFEGPIRRCACEMDYIIAISEYTKKDIIERFEICENKIKVVYPGLYREHNCARGKNGDMSSITGDEFLLTVSDMNPRKNHKGLIEAFTLYKDRNSHSPIKLVIAGTKDEEKINALMNNNRYADDIIFTGYISNEQLNWLYYHSIAVIYPSFFEGFGLPVLEAMAMRKAVITSNTTSLPEVGGDAVEYCDPYEPESICESIKKVLEDDDYRSDLEEKALIQSGKFSYQNAVRELYALYTI